LLWLFIIAVPIASFSLPNQAYIWFSTGKNQDYDCDVLNGKVHG